MFQVVDLASKFSAVILRDLGGEVLDQFDSRDQSPFEFAARIAQNARREDCLVTLIEDVPYGISSQYMVKPALNLQGVIMAFCHPVIEDVLWVSPSRWMADFPGVQRVPKELQLKGKAADDYRIEAAAQHARKRGYTPPDLVQQYIDSLPEGTKVLKKHTTPLSKNMTDYVSAFLMSEWALPLLRQGGRDELKFIQGVSPSLI